MSPSLILRGAGVCLLSVCALLPLACTPAAAPSGVNAAKTKVISKEAGVLELSDPIVTLHEDNLVKFEVKYKFTKGQPDRYYRCDISFPGTKNVGTKPMESWELKSEGVIKDGIFLSTPPVNTFEIQVSEAVSPQNGYKKISNVVTGSVK